MQPSEALLPAVSDHHSLAGPRRNGKNNKVLQVAHLTLICMFNWVDRNYLLHVYCLLTTVSNSEWWKLIFSFWILLNIAELKKSTLLEHWHPSVGFLLHQNKALVLETQTIAFRKLEAGKYNEILCNTRTFDFNFPTLTTGDCRDIIFLQR